MERRRYGLAIGSLLCLLAVNASIAQEHCGAVAWQEKMKAEGRIPGDDSIFENWLRDNMQRKGSHGTMRTKAGPYQVPVVVHIIHNGEPVGTGTNISEAQVLSQIQVLNEDFQRSNADAANTPPEFDNAAGSMDIEFVLAKQDPEGLATNGIVRVEGSKSVWHSEDKYELSLNSYWPAEDYFNIWVCNFDPLLGSAQFPESDLPGLGNSSENAFTDGIIVWYRAFGSIDHDDGTFDVALNFDKGRTVTHETGHFLGLHHIWGNDGSSCSGTDYVADTPNQSRSSSGCPTHPKEDNCSTLAMFQNYMDYTFDGCMNLFTEGQVDRMITVLENSPRRKSLLVSPGLQEPMPVPNDLGIRAMLAPGPAHCTTTVTPLIELRNYGSNNISSARIRFSANGSVIETIDFALDLDYLESTAVAFNPVLVAAGTTGLKFEIVQTNGGADGNPNNNNLEASVFVPESIAVPFVENMNTLPEGWTIQNPDHQIQWQLATAPLNTPENKALVMNFYNYEDNLGELDVLLSPVFDLSSVPIASLVFDRAYAQYQGSDDQLRIVVLRECQTLVEGTVIFDKEGDALATAPATSTPFIPDDATEWQRALINLDAFIGDPHVQVAFVAINDWGNNLYLDNVSLIVSVVEDITLAGVVSPQPVTCDLSPEPKLIVQNSGNIDITNFDIRYAVNDGAFQVHHVNSVNLQSGMEMVIDMPAINLASGLNHVTIDLDSPNGVTDSSPANDSLRIMTVVNTVSDRIPLREDFNGAFDEAWTMVSTEGGTNWEPVATNFGTSVYFNSYNNISFPGEAWLVSPVLDFSAVLTASMVFDLSHKSREGRRENLRILVSTDCGNTYSQVPFDFTASNESQPWTPAGEEDWQENIIVDLSVLAGVEEARVAFVVENANGNNLFIDNVEFFSTSMPDLIEIAEPFAIYGYNLSEPAQSSLKITFNLEQRSDVLFTVVDVMGKIHGNGLLTDVLNQTYPLELEQALAPGVYIIRLKIGDRFFSTRVLVPR